MKLNQAKIKNKNAVKYLLDVGDNRFTESVLPVDILDALIDAGTLAITSDKTKLSINGTMFIDIKLLTFEKGELEALVAKSKVK